MSRGMRCAWFTFSKAKGSEGSLQLHKADAGAAGDAKGATGAFVLAPLYSFF